MNDSNLDDASLAPALQAALADAVTPLQPDLTAYHALSAVEALPLEKEAEVR